MQRNSHVLVEWELRIAGWSQGGHQEDLIKKVQ